MHLGTCQVSLAGVGRCAQRPSGGFQQGSSAMPGGQTGVTDGGPQLPLRTSWGSLAWVCHHTWGPSGDRQQVCAKEAGHLPGVAGWCP